MNNLKLILYNKKPEKIQLFYLISISGPSGKPRVTAAHNTSSTSLFISWQPPDLNTIHGEFEGYKISYRPRDIAQAKAIEIPIENPKAKVRVNMIFKIDNLVIPIDLYF